MDIIAVYDCNPKSYKYKYLTNIIKSITPYINIVNLTDNLSIINKSIIFTDRYFPEYVLLNQCNIYYFTPNGIINPSDIFLLPYIRAIVVDNVRATIPIAELISRFGLDIPIYQVHAYADPNEYINSPIPDTINSSYIVNSVGIEMSGTTRHTMLSSDIISKSHATMIGNCDSSQPIIESMLCGRPILVPNNINIDFIYDGYNGVINNNIIQGISMSISLGTAERAYQMALHICNNNHKRILEILYGNRTPYKWIPQLKDDVWIVPGEILVNGQIEQIPSKYNTSIKVVQLDNIIDIYRFFINQKFSDVYVFGVDPKFENSVEINNLLLTLGSKSLKIHICTNIPIVTNNDTRNKISILSIDEGMRQVGQS